MDLLASRSRLATRTVSSRSATPAFRLGAWRPVASNRGRFSVSAYSVKFTGVGASVPSKVVTNSDLAKYVETDDEWISTRTGIKERRVLGEGEKLCDFAAKASEDALQMAGIAAEDLDMIIMATSSPDDAFGSATLVQSQLGISGCVAFDLTAACSGFVLATITASQFIRAGTAKNVLVIGADALSKYVDWRDRGTCILFGDGTGAMVMQAAEDGQDCNFLGCDMHSDGGGYSSLHASHLDNGNKIESAAPSAPAQFDNLMMKGNEVFKFAVRTVPQTVLQSCAAAGMPQDELDWLVCHQANQRILDSAANRLGIPAEKVVSNLSSYGNTSAASIPIAFSEAVQKGMIKKGDKVAIAGFGAGLTYASAIIQWG